MKKNFINIISCIIVTAAVVFLMVYLGKVLRPEYTDMSVVAVRTFHELPEDSVEVIIYGSSHAWRGVDSMEMYSGHGVGAYNYACNWQHINTTGLFVEDSLLTQSPKVALVECYRVGEIIEDCNPDGEIYYTRTLKNTEAKKRYLKKCFGDNKERLLAYYLPFAQFHYNWSELTRENFDFSYIDSGSLRKEMGAATGASDDSEESEAFTVEIPDWHEFWQQPLSDESTEELDRIVNACREKGTEVIFFVIPGMSGEYIYGDAMREYAKARGCTFLDFYDLYEEAQIDGKTDFADSEHLNAKGAAKLADYLGEYIVNNYEVTDFREIPENMWEMGL